jgi:glyoxylate/hydroxypyruvate reductase A
MRITFCCTGTAPEPWLQGLRAALPEGRGDRLGTRRSPCRPRGGVGTAPAFIDEQPGLKALFNIGAGVDALLRLRLPPGMQVVRLDDAGMSVQMAEYVCQAVIRHFREFDVAEADMAAGKWAFRKPRSRADFAVGIMGLGVLGSRVAQALQMFEFPVNGWSRSAKPATGALAGVHSFAGDAQLPGFLAASRVLVNLLPLTAQTENILNHANLLQLPAGAYVINVARGAHLVDADLLALLASGHLAGATLDVFRTEPLPAGHPFWQHPKLTLTPHTSARTLRDESVAQIARKIRALEAGQPISSLAGVVDTSLGY